MNFRDCLLILTNLFPYAEFDANTISATITAYLQSRGYAHPELLAKFTVKRMSRDLDRLHKMEFLGARRVKREVYTKRGTKCHRGYKYMYHVTAQGRQYYNYLLNPAEARQRNRQRMYQISYNIQRALGMPPEIIGRFPPELADVDGLYREIQARSSNAGRYNRFPHINDHSIVIKYMKAKQTLYSMLDARKRPLLYRLDQMSEQETRGLLESLERRKKTMLDPDSDNRYLSGLLRR